MADYKLILPAMGEGVMEATVIGWLKNVGDQIEEDEAEKRASQESLGRNWW